MITERFELIPIDRAQAICNGEYAGKILDRFADGLQSAFTVICRRRRLAKRRFKELLQDVLLYLIERAVVDAGTLLVRDEFINLYTNGFGADQVLDRRTDVDGKHVLSSVQSIVIVVVYVFPSGTDL